MSWAPLPIDFLTKLKCGRIILVLVEKMLYTQIVRNANFKQDYPAPQIPNLTCIVTMLLINVNYLPISNLLPTKSKTAPKFMTLLLF